MKDLPHSALIISFVSALCLLMLLIIIFGGKTLQAQTEPLPAVSGKIKLVSPELAAIAKPNPTAPESQDAVSARQAFSLTLNATVGLDPNVCAGDPIINIPTGTTVVICYFITNTGDESIEFHSVDDEHLGRIVTKQPFSLGPGVSALITTTRRITETTVHMGTWHGLDESGAILVSASAQAKSYVDGLVVESGLQQLNGSCWWANDLSIPPNATVDFCYRLLNQSDLTLSQHTLVEGRRGEIASSVVYPLGPGESVTLEELGITLSQPITTTSDFSLAWRAATTTSPSELPSQEFAVPINLSTIGTLKLRVPDLSSRLTVGLQRDVCAETTELTVFAGTEITFCYSASNTGGVTFTNHTVTDNFIPADRTAGRSNQHVDSATERIVREHEPFHMAPGIAGQFTQAQVVNQSTIITMTWVAYSANPVSGTVNQYPSPSTLTFPLPYVSATSTSQISITVLPLASVDFTIYEDSNQNGARDSTEPAIRNATVQLTATNETSYVSTTDIDGAASFTDLRPAVYEIAAGFEQTPYIYDPVDDNINSILLRSGQNAEVNLGYVRTGRRTQKIFVPVQIR